MAVTITGRYIGNLKMELEHGPSGTHLVTAAPTDNMGDGSSFLAHRPGRRGDRRAA
jgi:hypothetical protein